MYNTLDEQFDKLCSRYIAIIEKTIKDRITRARDKEAVADEIKNEVTTAQAIMAPHPTAVKLVNMFIKEYKHGQGIEEILATLKMVFGTNVYTTDQHGNIIGEAEILNEPYEEKKLRLMVDNKKELVKYLVRYAAIIEVQKRISNGIKVNEQTESKNEPIYPAQWTGGKDRDNKNEFVQLIYALHEAGYLNKGKGEITKIIEALADTLQVGLGKNWQSNLSASIHKSNTDYQPPIFEKIKQGYMEYADKLVTAKKTNK